MKVHKVGAKWMKVIDCPWYTSHHRLTSSVCWYPVAADGLGQCRLSALSKGYNVHQGTTAGLEPATFGPMITIKAVCTTMTMTNSNSIFFFQVFYYIVNKEL